MDDENLPEVKEFTERVEVTPAEGDDELEEGDTDPDSSQDDEGAEGDGEEPVAPAAPEHIETTTPAPAPVSVPHGLTEDDLKEVPGETPRERALRLEVTRLRHDRRLERVNELVGPTTPVTTTPATDEVLAKYKPEELQSLREVLPVLAKEMGFVRKDELASDNFATQSEAELNVFLEAHPEYLPENDPDNLLWRRFREEFNRFKTPTSPKEYKQIFERVHRDVFGIQPAGALQPTVTAAAKKIESASHTVPTTPPPPTPRIRPAASGALRTDMLKGFTNEDLKEMGLE